MATDAEFIETIRERPDDDVPRLIYADWLDEHDDPKGEFIRVQIQLAGMTRDDPARWDLELRQHRLLHRHGWEWIYKPFDPHPRYFRPGFVRGFVEAAAMPAAVFLQDPDEALAMYPCLHTLVLHDFRRLETAGLFPLCDVPLLLRLKTLTVVTRSGSVPRRLHGALRRHFGDRLQFSSTFVRPSQ